ncbi:MAG: N-acetylmuramoyl-L-alanine amidase [Bryobacterales bacterium]|nr:N-acetylmuramoyl-L-alanine amidase [Bryobacterales bacterium]
MNLLGHMKWGRWACICAVWPLMLPAQTPRVSALKEVRYWSSVDNTRVAIELSQPVQFKHGRLSNPDRAFVDLVDVHPNPSFRGVAYTIPVSDGLVDKIRVAPNQARVTRVVLDLGAAAEVTASELVNPTRIVLDVRRVGGGGLVPAAPATSEIAPPTPAPPPPPVSRQQPAPERPVVVAKATPPALPSPPPPASASPAATEPVEKPASGAQSARLVTPSLTRALGLKLSRVVLDAGHGGHDPGSDGVTGLVEKELTLDVTLRLGKLLEERMGIEVVYTRKNDSYVDLEERCVIANKVRADLFLSIHANTAPARSVVGTETYYLNRGGSRDDLALAARENMLAQKRVSDLNDLVKRILLSDKRDESREFASRIQSATHELSKETHGQIHNRGVRSAPLVVLIGATMPSVLVEIGFLSNAREEALLRKADHRQKIAEALYKGVLSYAQSLSHFSMARQADGE